jgi:hypothetical protein
MKDQNQSPLLENTYCPTEIECNLRGLPHSHDNAEQVGLLPALLSKALPRAGLPRLLGADRVDGYC